MIGQVIAFLVNIREPACRRSALADPFALVKRFPVWSPGRMGWISIRRAARAFVACDGKHGGHARSRQRSRTGRYRLRVPRMPSGTITSVAASTLLSRTGHLDEAPGVINVVNTHSMTVEEQIPTEVGAHTTAF